MEREAWRWWDRERERGKELECGRGMQPALGDMAGREPEEHTLPAVSLPLLIWHCFPWSEHNRAARGPGACWSRARGLLSGHREGGRKAEEGFGGQTKDKPVNCFSEIQKDHVDSEK